MKIQNTLTDIAEALLKGTGIYSNISTDSEVEKIYGSTNTYIQFAYLSKPGIAPSGMWSMMEGGREIESWGAEWDQYADRGGIRIMSDLTCLPDDVDAATEVMKAALAAFQVEVAEQEQTECRDLRNRLFKKARQARSIYLDLLGQYREELDDDGDRVYTDEEAEYHARYEARFAFPSSEDPCVYIQDGNVVAWDWDPRSRRYQDTPWDAITVEIAL